MLEVLLVLAVAVPALSKPQAIHLVYSEAETNGALPALPEPRSGVAYVFSVPVSNIQGETPEVTTIQPATIPTTEAVPIEEEVKEVSSVSKHISSRPSPPSNQTQNSH